METWVMAFFMGLFAGIASTMVKNKVGQLILIGLFFIGTWIWLGAG